MARLTYLLFAASMWFFVSCGKRSDKKIPVNEMKKVMWDMVCADEMYAEASLRDTTLKTKKENFRLYEQVFAIHKISKAEFYSSYRYYQLHPDDFKILMDSLQSYSTSQKNKSVRPALKNLAD